VLRRSGRAIVSQQAFAEDLAATHATAPLVLEFLADVLAGHLQRRAEAVQVGTCAPVKRVTRAEYTQVYQTLETQLDPIRASYWRHRQQIVAALA
jgi:hypothetical protein